MAAESEQPEIPDGLSPEGVRQYLIRFLGQQNPGEHEEVYGELATK